MSTNPIGRLPRPNDLDTSGLNVAAESLLKLLSVDVDGWLAEIPLIQEHFAKFGTHLPDGLRQELENLDERLRTSISAVGKASRMRKVSSLGRHSEGGE